MIPYARLQTRQTRTYILLTSIVLITLYLSKNAFYGDADGLSSSSGARWRFPGLGSGSGSKAESRACGEEGVGESRAPAARP